MAIYQIVTIGDDILRDKAKKVTKFDERIYKLLNNMMETLIKEDGVGLAAPQIGVSKRVIIAFKEDEDKIIEVINPEIISSSGEECGEEGCLSVPGKVGLVKRAKDIVVIGQNAKGESIQYKASGMFARILQHEIDHLNGILFIDKVEKVEKY
ncbi:MAG: peptide deformylase [Firmicutes bacterium]|nr:peptide deformylase [Bacillota bacterium]